MLCVYLNNLILLFGYLTDGTRYAPGVINACIIAFGLLLYYYFSFSLIFVSI